MRSRSDQPAESSAGRRELLAARGVPAADQPTRVGVQRQGHVRPLPHPARREPEAPPHPGLPPTPAIWRAGARVTQRCSQSAPARSGDQQRRSAARSAWPAAAGRPRHAAHGSSSFKRRTWHEGAGARQRGDAPARPGQRAARQRRRRNGGQRADDPGTGSRSRLDQRPDGVLHHTDPCLQTAVVVNSGGRCRWNGVARS